jgi:uncharacterized coiled-coil DUF342 family protein
VPDCGLAKRIDGLERDTATLGRRITETRDAIPSGCQKCKSFKEVYSDLNDLRAEIAEVQAKYKTKATTQEWESAMSRIRQIEAVVRAVVERGSFKRGSQPVKIPWAHN